MTPRRHFPRTPLRRTRTIYDKNVARAQALAKKYGIEHVLADADSLLAYGDFDAVSLVTPGHLHADIIVACVQAKSTF